MISKFNHKKLAQSMSSTNVSKNPYRSISLNLMLEQNILNNDHHLANNIIHPKSWFPLDFSSCLAHFSRRFEMLFITRRFNWASLQLLRFEGGMSFLLLLLLFPIIQDLFLPNFLARIEGLWAKTS